MYAHRQDARTMSLFVEICQLIYREWRECLLTKIAPRAGLFYRIGLPAALAERITATVVAGTIFFWTCEADVDWSAI